METIGHLARREANHIALTPVDFLTRSLEAFPNRPAVVWRDRAWTYGQLAGLVERLGDWLQSQGVGVGDVVSVMALNRPEMLAAHFAVPMIGAVLNTINTRLDTDTVGYILDHSKSRLMIADAACLASARAAAGTAGVALFSLDGTDAEAGAAHLALLAPTDGPARPLPRRISDEWQPICINYTSGTTGRPKGVVYHHRGATLNTLGNVIALQLSERSVYLWTLPMFHCNGWCHTWAVTAAGGLNVCLERPDPALIYRAIEAHRVSHFCCAPVVLYMLINHDDRKLRQAGRRVLVGTGGAAPTSALIEQLDALGFDLIHLYGLTESYGPATLMRLDESLAAAAPGRKAAYLARQGSPHIAASAVRLIDGTGQDVASDGTSIGEIVLSGNTLMAGYYRDEEATERAFAGGLLHTGDLAVRHPDGHMEIRDRAKDIIISGGENISSLEVESVLHRHPAVLLAAVVAAPDAKWGEIPCAFLELKPGATIDAEEVRQFCRERLAGFKVPRRVIVRELPKTATGKVQKFQLRQEAKG